MVFGPDITVLVIIVTSIIEPSAFGNAYASASCHVTVFMHIMHHSISPLRRKILQICQAKYNDEQMHKCVIELVHAYCFIYLQGVS